MKKVICSEKAPGAIGPYSQAIEANGMVFVSGQLPIDAATGQMAEGIEGQARQSLENIKHILEEAGLTMGNIAKTTVSLHRCFGNSCNHILQDTHRADCRTIYTPE